MAILNITMGSVGLVGVTPRVIYIDTNDTLATVTTTGYLNKAKQQGYSFNESDMACVSTRPTPTSSTVEVAWLEVSISGTNVSLVPIGAPGQVVLPTTANYIVHATNATGTLSTAAANVINAGNISAGLSGTAGYFASFPGTAARGSLRFVAANSAGDTVTQVTNASMAAARVFTIPDGGQAASSFLITDSAGTQTIATGSLALTLGNLTVAAGNIAATLGSLSAGTTVTAGTGITSTTGNITASAGNVIAGASGAAGTLTSFPATAANGSLIISALNAGGAFNTTIRNSVMGQSSVISIPDPAAATANFAVAPAALVNNNLIKASGTAGLVADAGIAASAVQLSTNIKAATTADIGGGGAGPISVVVAGLTAASVVVATVEASTNAVSVVKCTATATGFDITFSADPGASCTVNYVAFIAAQ